MPYSYYFLQYCFFSFCEATMVGTIKQWWQVVEKNGIVTTADLRPWAPQNHVGDHWSYPYATSTARGHASNVGGCWDRLTAQTSHTLEWLHGPIGDLELLAIVSLELAILVILITYWISVWWRPCKPLNDMNLWKFWKNAFCWVFTACNTLDHVTLFYRIEVFWSQTNDICHEPWFI